MRGWRYGATLGVILAGLGGGSWLVFDAIQGDASPFAAGVTAAAPATTVSPNGVASTGDVASVAPAGEAGTPGTAAGADAVASTPTTGTGDGTVASTPNTPRAPVASPAPWRPDPRQALADSIFLLANAGRGAEALRLLDEWLRTHPDDHAMRLEAARLRVRTGDTAGAWRDYERVLAATTDSAAVLAEYARALLAQGAHAEAARRFGMLAAREPGVAAWRLGQARALAWDGRGREALAVLHGAPEDGAGEVAALRRRLREELELSVAEARAWSLEAPDDAAAQLALARALAREGRPAEAVAAYERLAAADAAVLQEAAGVAAAVPDSVAAARLLGRAARLAPADTALARRHADALAWAGDRVAALAVLDRLVAESPTADRLRTRAELRMLTGDRAGARADLGRVLDLDPTARDHATLGDWYRWDGDRPRARASYGRALALDPASGAARDGLAQLRADAFRDLPWDADEGVGLASASIDDNEGFGSRTVRASAGVALGAERRTVVSAGAEWRRLERARPGFTGAPAVEGWGADLGLAQRVGRVRLGARGGAVGFDGTETVPTWALSAEGPLARGTWRLALADGPAYETLRAGTAVGDGTSGGGDDVLTGLSASGTVNAPLAARLDLWARLEALALSDDNTRLSAQAALRLGVAPSVSVLWSGSVLAFADATRAYWSPRYFTLQSGGLEWRRRWAGGLVLAAQGLAGVSWYDESFPGEPRVAGSAFQWSVGGEAGWQAPRWDVGLTGAYGTDRAGTYEAFVGSLRLRYRW
jgi:tetratricopeptide (TPR) repeat protein